MKQRILFCVLILCGFLVFASGSLRAQSPVTIALSLSNPGASIPQDFSGVSYETSALLGGNYFRSSNQPLLHMFSVLGIKNLRIGGNNSGQGGPPSHAQNTSPPSFFKATTPQPPFHFPLTTLHPP